MNGRRPLARDDVVLVSFPFTDLSGQKLRPAVVVGRVSGDDVIVAFVTSQSVTRSEPSGCVVAPDHPEFGPTGLRTGSTIRLDKLATLERRLVVRRLGHVGPRIRAAVASALRYTFEL